MARTNAARDAVAACGGVSSAMHGADTRSAPVETSGPDATSVEPSASNAAPTARERVIRNQTCGYENETCQCDESKTKHGDPPDDWGAVNS
jgi:hypothetical protein